MRRHVPTLFLLYSIGAGLCLAQNQGGDLTTAVVGFEQAGASSARSDQKFFFDFFISRPLPFSKSNVDPFGPRVRWWGNVRIASYPQQINTSVAEFATTFANRVGALKVNEIAQFGEFRSGPDIRIKAFDDTRKLIPNFGASAQQSSF